jgi:putative hydrolase of the HAD superfamily
MSFKAVIFDLDDTLYNEFLFVKSGFKVVAKYLASLNQVNFSESEILEQLLIELSENGRGKVFNNLIIKLNLSEEKYLSTLIFLYRNHIPNEIKLDPKMKLLLEKLISDRKRLGVITDGIYVTQKNKTDILLKNLPIEFIIHTDALGQKLWKPSPEPFKVALNLLKLDPNETVYIGDNPTKDFKGAKIAQMKTIWWNPSSQKKIFEDDFSKPDMEANCVLDLYQLIESE